MIEVSSRVLVDLTRLTSESFAGISRRFKKKIVSLKDLFSKLKPDFYKSYGKVGYIILDKDGNEVKKVPNRRYFTDKRYRDSVNRHGVTPVFRAKIKRSKANSIDIEQEVEDFKKENHLDDFKKGDETTYFKTLKKVGVGAVMYGLIKTSIQRQVHEGVSNKDIQKSVNEGIRHVVLEEVKSKHAGRMCRLTTTSAENPDKSHVHLEWIPMPCEEAFRYVGRIGCQHDVEVLISGLLTN